MRLGTVSFWFAAGLVTAIILHYALYRIALPTQPFIYQAF